MYTSRFFPVILATPENKTRLTGREKTAFLSEWAVRALHISADFGKYDPGPFLKNETGAPKSHNGVYWSVTHKPLYVGGVCASFPVGIDIEKIRSFHGGLFHKTAAEDEWRLFGEKEPDAFFRMWTAKESVLKKEVTGIADLLKCKLKEVEDNETLILDYLEKRHVVHQISFDGHIAAVALDFSLWKKDGVAFDWKILQNPKPAAAF